MVNRVFNGQPGRRMGNSQKSASGYRRGGRHHNARLTDHEVETIRQLYADGMRATAIARKFGVTKGYLSKLLRHLAR